MAAEGAEGATAVSADCRQCCGLPHVPSPSVSQHGLPPPAPRVAAEPFKSQAFRNVANIIDAFPETITVSCCAVPAVRRLRLPTAQQQ